MTLEKEPTQIFCSCGEPLETWSVPEGHVSLPIEWVEDGCQKCRFNKVTKDHRDSKNNSTD